MSLTPKNGNEPYWSKVQPFSAQKDHHFQQNHHQQPQFERTKSQIGNIKGIIQPEDMGNHLINKDERIMVIEMQNTINLLRHSLMKATARCEELQENLYRQKTKSYDLSQVKRNLEEELARLEFRLEQIETNDQFNHREASIKLQSLMTENQKLRFHSQDLQTHLGKHKQQNTQLLNHFNKLLKEKQQTQKDNILLLEEIQAMEKELQMVKSELYQKGNQANAVLKNIPTTRTQKQESLHHIRVVEPKKIKVSEPRIELVKDSQVTKQEYSQLKQQNSFLKGLYSQFYSEANVSLNIASSQLLKQPIMERSREDEERDRNEKLMLQTTQRQAIRQEIEALREQVIGELLGSYYQTAINQGRDNNSFKIFVGFVRNDIEGLDKMALNYLEARQIVMQESNCELEKEYHSITLSNDNEKWLHGVYQTIKDNAKREAHKQNGYYLALFRLLTVLDKVKGVNQQLLAHLKHTSIKYLHKIMDHAVNNKDIVAKDL